MIALNQFTVTGGNDMIGSISIDWESPVSPNPCLNGLSYIAVIWSDPDGDGSPWQNRSYVAAAPGGMGDIINLTNNTSLPLNTIESYGLIGSFMIRAHACIPEPTTMTLIVFAGLAGFIGYGRSSKRKGALQNSNSTRIAYHHRPT